MTEPYRPRRTDVSRFFDLRGQRYHAHVWGDASLASTSAPPLVLVHGWMDVGASFQFVVDALAADRWVVAPDWRGYGRTEGPPTDSYWFPDYLGDLDALLDALSPDVPVDLAGHSMGGNVVMSYAGVRPQRIRRLVNLEGFGLPRSEPDNAAKRMRHWLDELKAPQSLRPYASVQAVAERLRQNNPRLTPERAAWLAPHWSEQRSDGLWHVRGDPAHKRTNPQLYRVDEILAGWRRIEAPLLVVEGDSTDPGKWWGTRYTLDEFHQRLQVVPHAERVVLADAGHMLHHDQPQALAALLDRFLAP